MQISLLEAAAAGY